jgi:hypothetical protein
MLQIKNKKYKCFKKQLYCRQHNIKIISIQTKLNKKQSAQSAFIISAVLVVFHFFTDLKFKVKTLLLFSDKNFKKLVIYFST